MLGRAELRGARWVATSLALALACEAEPPTASPSPTDTPFGLDILTVRDCPAPAHEQLSLDERLVGVEVELHANRGGVPANFYYGRLTDAQGNTYGPTFSGCAPRLSSTPLAVGAVKRGFVNFKVPARAAGLTFSYAPRLADGGAKPASSISLPLGR